MRHKKIFRRRLVTHHQMWKIKRFFREHRALAFMLTAIFLIGLVVGILSVIPAPQEPAPPVIQPPQEVVKETVTKEVEVQVEDTYKISARDGVILGRYGNALDLSGEYVQPIEGSVIQVSVNTKDEFGIVEAVFPQARVNTEDQAYIDGEVKLTLNRVRPIEDFESGILLDEELFGDTGNWFELLPKTRVLFAAMGQGDMLLDDQEVYGNLNAIVLYTEGIRDENLAIGDGKGSYTVKRKKDSFADPRDRELHLFLFSDIEDKKNFPPRHVWINAFFEDPRVISVPEGAKK